jgi:two-component system sensor histidine kinase KdpD
VARGVLRVYLGAAPGVGKTFAMLNEGRRRRTRGTDVVVGFVETHGRKVTAEQVGDLEVVPRRRLDYRGSTFEEMDVDAVLARAPEVALVDELAHTNVPGSRNPKRWQDAQELLDAGIDVISTVNIQHLESVNDVVERITGVVQRETLPDEVVRRAEQVELVDMTPEALRRRMAHGNIYPAERVDAALANYFRPGNLAALRELALLWVADRVEDSLQDYMEAHGISATWETRERVVVAVTGAPGGEHLIRRASRMARRARGDLLGVHVRAGEGVAGPPAGHLERHRRLVEELGGTFHEIVAADAAAGLISFARAEHATQLVLGATRRPRWREVLGGSVINRVIRASGDVDVHVISTRLEGEERPPLPAGRRRRTLSRRRLWLGWLVTTAGLPLLTLVLTQLRDHVDLPGVLLIYLLAVVLVAVVGGAWPAAAAAIAAALLANWFFTPPLHTLTIGDPVNVIALVVFLGVAAVVSGLMTLAARRTIDAARSRAEADALVRLAGALLTEDDPLPEIMDQLRRTFGLAAVAVLRRAGADTWRTLAATGDPVPAYPDEASDTVDLDPQTVIAVVGPDVGADDRAMLRAFTAQLAVALEARELRAEAAAAAALAEADQLRTGLLRAVSHDLRTPLATIKASASTLLAHEVHLSESQARVLHQTIEGEADRLSEMVSNLLAMSRLQAGGVQLVCGAVAVDEVVAAALVGLGSRAAGVVLDVPDDLPRVHADPALLERAVANVVDNALRWSPSEQPVRVEAAPVGARVDIRVVDHGPGIPPADRDRIFQPFQRLDDRSPGGVGLGLAVARGFVKAMRGRLSAEDTPGGGATFVFELEAVR